MLLKNLLCLMAIASCVSWPIAISASEFTTKPPTAAPTTQEAIEQLPSESQQLYKIILKWREAPGIQVATQWTVQMRASFMVTDESTLKKDDADKTVTMAAKANFLAKEARYRISQEYENMPEMKYEIAYDGRHFQVFGDAFSRMHYTKNTQRDAFTLLLPVVQIQPFQFLGGEDSEKPGFVVAWPDIFNDNLIIERLAKGVVGFKEGKAGRRVTLTVPGGKYEGESFSYLLYLDGPQGQISCVEYVGKSGKIIAKTEFEYSIPKEAGAWSIPVNSKFSHYKNDKIIMSVEAKADKVQFSPQLTEDAFTIDFTSIDTVYDADAQKTVKDANAKNTAESQPASNPATPDPAVDSSGGPATIPAIESGQRR